MGKVFLALGNLSFGFDFPILVGVIRPSKEESTHRDSAMLAEETSECCNLEPCVLPRGIQFGRYVHKMCGPSTFSMISLRHWASE